MKPKLFNTETVRAILEGRKTVTRQYIKFLKGKNPSWTGYVKDGLMLYNGNNEPCCQKPPYQVGDVLYVRETWFYASCANCDGDMADGICSKRESGEEPTGCYFYKADNNNFEWDDKRTHWRPSIHMPKEASRIFLKVTDVGVERLRDITEEQAVKEGARFIHLYDNEYDQIHTAREYFIDIWQSTIKKKDLHIYGWDVNPYVWVIEFERCENPESEGT